MNALPDTTPPLLTRQQAAELLTISIRSLDRLILGPKPQIQSIKVNKFRRVPRIAIERFILNQMEPQDG